MRTDGGTTNGRTPTLMRPLALLAAALGSALLLPGCSHERYSYASTAHVPLSIAMKNTTTGETVWSYDVPVGQQLNLTFQRDADLADAQGYDDMVWTVCDLGKVDKGRTNTLRVPPPSERRLEMSVRSTNEPRLAAPVESERANANAAYPPTGPGLFPRTAPPTPDAAPGNAPAAPASAPTAKPKTPPQTPAIALPDPKQQAPK
ncbi:MAG: hypothetical protein WC718_17230 [Phycisphaerales bacterium]